MSSVAKSPSAISNDGIEAKAKNTANRPGSEAVRGAVLAFTTNAARQPSNHNAAGARAAALAAGDRVNQPSIQPSTVSTPPSGSQGPRTSPDNVRIRVQNLERSKTKGDVAQTQQAQRESRPRRPQSDSHVAAKLASTNAAQKNHLVSFPSVYETPPSAQSRDSTAAADGLALPEFKGKGSRNSLSPHTQTPLSDYDNSSVLYSSSSTIPPDATGLAKSTISATVADKPTRTPSIQRAPRSDSSPSPSPFSEDQNMVDHTSPPRISRLSIAPPPKPISLQLRRNTNKPQLMPRSSSNLAPQNEPRYSHDSLTVDTLADAMVASSLASSRAPSPTKSFARPLPRRQHSKSRNFFHHNHPSSSGPSRTASPSKSAASGMRQTLRTHVNSDDEVEDARGRRRHLVRKHPNKHHEGDRRRWRDEITEKERRRYEGVWAANRGLYISPVESASQRNSDAFFMHTINDKRVLNLVVRELWQRSRLSELLLEEIWDLITIDEGEGEKGSLGKEGFVVGMWLIDQSLKGRKLPIRVSSSVWSSARRTLSIQLRRGEG